MSGRALVVDDDEMMVRTLADVLRLQGWTVETAYRGDAAVRAAAAEAFDVVLMDVKMPGMDGVDAFRAMKRARPGIRVVLMTAYAERARIEEAQREGAVRVLAKPVDIGALLALLEAQLRRKHPVLVVDRDAVFLRTLCDVLAERGFSVAMATDVPHAIRLMDHAEPLAVLLHVPPGADHARDAVRAVHEHGPTVALILYSGRDCALAVVDDPVAREWVHAYLQKPFAVEHLTEVLDEVRDQR